jgi:hypothetical protein
MASEEPAFPLLYGTTTARSAVEEQRFSAAFSLKYK